MELEWKVSLFLGLVEASEFLIDVFGGCDECAFLGVDISVQLIFY